MVVVTPGQAVHVEVGAESVAQSLEEALNHGQVEGWRVDPGDLHSLIGIARLYDQLNDIEQSVTIYRQVLEFDASNVEAISCLASNYFYTDQPELALRLYRRCAASAACQAPSRCPATKGLPTFLSAFRPRPVPCLCCKPPRTGEVL